MVYIKVLDTVAKSNEEKNPVDSEVDQNSTEENENEGKYVNRVFTYYLIIGIVINGFAMTILLLLMMTHKMTSKPSRMFCADADTRTLASTNSDVVFERQIHFFQEVTILYGRYLRASNEKICNASADQSLWYSLFKTANKDFFHGSKPVDDDKYREFFEKVKKLGCLKANILKTRNNDKTKSNSNVLQLWNRILENANLNLTHLRNNLDLEKEVRENQEVASILEPGRFSADQKYVLYDGIVYGEKFETLSQTSKITLATQTSLDRLNSFLSSSAKWNGPISLAVFQSGFFEYFLFRDYLSYLKRCQRDVYDRTVFSIATPVESAIIPGSSIQTTHLDNVSCSTNADQLNNIIVNNINESKNWLKNKWYPQNTMRNLAIKNVRTSYHLTLDIDIIPCLKMSESLNAFLSNNSIHKNGLVIPTYEISKKVKFPSNKAELVALSRKGLAQPFHKDVFALNQNATNFTKWEKMHDTFEDVTIISKVAFHLFYEPFFVEHRTSPRYNESFVGYGFTRSSHAYEMYLKNGDFVVLSPVFTVQIGLQKTKEWSPERQKQNDYNRHLFEEFVANLKKVS